MTEETGPELSLLTATVVAAYVSNNKLSTGDLTELIGTTYQALKGVGEPVAAEPQTPKPDKAAVRKSISPDHLISFIDGRKYKSLKRHLTTHGTTPAEYRETYGLPSDYPMVAASYSAARSALAKSLGLGRKAAGTPTPDPQPEPEAPKAKGRGRPKAIKPQDETFD